MNIYVGNISFQLSESDLESAFAEHGAVDSCLLYTSPSPRD